MKIWTVRLTLHWAKTIYFHADKIYGNIVKMADKSFSRHYRPSFHTFPYISNSRNMLCSPSALCKIFSGLILLMISIDISIAIIKNYSRTEAI